MKQRRVAQFLLASLMATAVAPHIHAIPAFSGAEGPGGNATGGRGGDVYHVTNLEFDLNGVIPGSLKYGINTAPATGRTIVFDVGGTIYHEGGGAGWWFRSGKSNITVAGQTAPGPGITIAGVGSKWTGNNVILRNVTVRPNKDPINPTSFTYDAFSTQLTNSIIDHVSASWHSDEGISSTDAGHTTTVQYALVNEGLNYDSHSFGSIISTEVDGAQLSFHHNLYAHNNSRVPRLGSEMAVTQTGAVTNFANNVIYNWINRAGYSGTDQPSSTNFLSNYYIKGNNNGSTLFTGGDSTTYPGVTKIFHSGNLYDANKNGMADGTTVTNSNFAGSKAFVSSAFNITGVGVLDSAGAALQRVLDYGGANWANRNPIDARVVQGVRDGTGAIVLDLTTGSQAAEWATVLSQQAAGGVAPFVRPANWDTDNDGMPDNWELEHHLDPIVASNNGDFDSDGYSDLEEYINEIAAWPAPGVIKFTNGLADGRFARIENWQVVGQQVNVTGLGLVTTTSNWQPSRFDTVHFQSGVSRVDAVGQHAGNLVIAPGAGEVAQLDITAGWLRANDAVVIGGAPTAAGTLNLSGGVLDTPLLTKGAAGTFNFTGGTLHANAVNFSLVNNGGTLAPGHSPGITQITGDLTLNSGVLEIEIGGTQFGQYDRVEVSGVTHLGGTLKVNLVDLGTGTYLPQLGDSFGFLASQLGTGGAFTYLDLPTLSAGLAWTISPGNVTNFLQVVSAPSAGDYNNDDVIDAADYALWRESLANNSPLANETASLGVVDIADYDVWRANFGRIVTTSSGVVSSSSVPEPYALALLTLGACFLSLLRSRCACR